MSGIHEEESAMRLYNLFHHHVNHLSAIHFGEIDDDLDGALAAAKAALSTADVTAEEVRELIQREAESAAELHGNWAEFALLCVMLAMVQKMPAPVA
jgi:hypothetical protein